MLWIIVVKTQHKDGGMLARAEALVHISPYYHIVLRPGYIIFMVSITTVYMSELTYSIHVICICINVTQ